MSLLRLFLVVAALAVTGAVSWVDASQQRRAYTAPETFTSPLQTRTAAGAAAATIKIQIDRYHSANELKTMTDAMTQGGYPGFLAAMRKAPAVGYVEIGDVKVALRWARELTNEKKGRTISLVTERPVYFIGGGKADAKPRAGFELAVVQLNVDEFGLGSGTMAAAAKVKKDPDGTGVLIEDYAEEPIKLTFVHREIK
jgi:hypothetical protein